MDSYLSNLAILAREADFAGTGIILRGAAAGAQVQTLIRINGLQDALLNRNS